MKNVGIEVQGKTVNVVDYSKKERTFSKLLTKKAIQNYEATGYLPEGVTVSEKHPVIETFETVQEAQHFIAKGCKVKPDPVYGVFKSKAQYLAAKRLVK